MKKIAILCSGGDVSGMNAALKRFVEYCRMKKVVPHFVHNGFEGLIDDMISEADYPDVAGIIMRGGTKIGSARSVRFMQERFRARAISNLHARGIDALIVLGGDGSFRGMKKLCDESDVAFAGIPATIDNDIAGTEYALGVDTALNVIKGAIDAIRDTASSFGRAFVIETMGRECGYLALVSALTCGAEMCLIPEIPYDLEHYQQRFEKEGEKGRTYFIAVVSEALGETEAIKKWFEEKIGIEARTTVLGHIQRGGNPTVHDRLMAFRFVTRAVDGLTEGKKSSVVCYSEGEFVHRSIETVAFHKATLSEELLRLGREFDLRV